jgi:hypothetical protein
LGPVDAQVRCAAIAGPPLFPEWSDFLDDVAAEAKVHAFLDRSQAASCKDADTIAGASVAWICDALPSNHSVKAYGREQTDFIRHIQAPGVAPA